MHHETTRVFVPANEDFALKGSIVHGSDTSYVKPILICSGAEHIRHFHARLHVNDAFREINVMFPIRVLVQKEHQNCLIEGVLERYVSVLHLVNRQSCVWLHIAFLFLSLLSQPFLAFSMPIIVLTTRLFPFLLSLFKLL